MDLTLFWRLQYFIFTFCAEKKNLEQCASSKNKTKKANKRNGHAQAERNGKKRLQKPILHSTVLSRKVTRMHRSILRAERREKGIEKKKINKIA